MSQKRLNHRYLSWWVLFGLLFHILVAHHRGAEELLLSQQSDGHLVLESGFQHLEAHHTDFSDFHGHAHDPPHEAHQHLALFHSDWYLASASSDGFNLIALRWAASFALLPVFFRFSPEPLAWAARGEHLERPPPWPAFSQQVLTSTILLI